MEVYQKMQWKNTATSSKKKKVNLSNESKQNKENKMNQTNQQLKVLELFAGMGSPAKALKNLNIDHQIIDAVEIDEKAMKAYNSIHSTNFEIQDIQK